METTVYKNHRFKKAYEGEADLGEIMTVPGQSFTVQELRKRLQSGMQVVKNSGFYTEDVPIMRIRNLNDLQTAREHINSIYEKKAELEKKLADSKQNKASRKDKEASADADPSTAEKVA